MRNGLGAAERLAPRKAGANPIRRLIEASHRPIRISLQSLVMNWVDRLDPREVLVDALNPVLLIHIVFSNNLTASLNTSGGGYAIYTEKLAVC